MRGHRRMLVCLAHLHAAIEVSAGDDYFLCQARRHWLVDGTGGAEPPREARGGHGQRRRPHAPGALFQRVSGRQGGCSGGRSASGVCVRRGVCVACTLGVAALAFVEVERAACGHRPGSVRLWEGAEHVCCGSANVTT